MKRLNFIQIFICLTVLLLAVFSCTDASTSLTSTPSNVSQVRDFLAGAKDRYANGITCGPPLPAQINGLTPDAFQSMKILDETTLSMNGTLFHYGVIALGYEPEFTSVDISDYTIHTGPPPTPATTGGQSFQVQAYRGSELIGEFVFYEIPFQIDSYSVFITTNSIGLLLFPFIYYKPDCNSWTRLWLVLLSEETNG